MKSPFIALPNALLDSLKSLPCFDNQAFAAVHTPEAVAPVSIRVNPHKAYRVPENVSPVAWCENGFYLPQRPSFTLDPHFHAGCYYVQEASSMCLDFILKQLLPQDNGLRALDLCAAPGGKTTLLQAALPPESLVVANEVIKTRSTILAENLSKWGAMNTVVTNNDPSDFAKLAGWFDVLLVDAPCSGSGMFRKDNQAISEWSPENVVLCAQRQQRILSDVLPALKEDGLLVYATCSYSVAEDEAIVDWLISEWGMESVPVEIPENWGVVTTQTPVNQAKVLRFFPHLVAGEGLFVACLRKTTADETPFKWRSRGKNQPNKNELKIVSEWLSADAPEIALMNLQETVIALPKYLEDDIQCIAENFYLRKAGTRIGQISPKELIPDHELALSCFLNRENCATIELTLPQALSYLRRDDFELDLLQRGWLCACYEGVPLGWLKSLGNRFNNYYPKEWRVQMR